MYPEELSNCGCPQEPTTPPVAPPAPPICNNGEPCPEVMNTSCVRYDGPDIPGVAATGDNMTEVLQGLSNNGNIGGANNFTLQPALDGSVTINGGTDPVVVDTPGQIIEISAVGAQGPPGVPGQSVTVEGYTSTYTTLLADFPAPDPLTVVMLTDIASGVNGTIYVYDPTSSSADINGWVNLGQISGPPGSNGLTGPAGPAGNLILSGSTNPLAALGNVGDYYINTTTNTLIGPKQLSGWPVAGISLVGPVGQNGAPGATGATGATGPAGQNGAPGAQGLPGQDGSKIYSGSSTPLSTTGIIGDYYLNTTTYTLIGPKTSSGWPATGLLLKGADGAPGLPGANGAPGATGPAGSNGANSSTGVAGFRDLGSTTTAWTLKADAPVGSATAGGTATTSNTTDAGIVILTESASAVIVTVPLSLTNFPPGHQVTIMQKGTGQVRIVGATGVTIESANNMQYLRTRYSAATLVKRSDSLWYMFGDLTNVVV